PNLLRTRDHVRLDLDVPAAANVADASQDAILRNGRHCTERSVLEADTGPDHAFILPVDHSREHQAELELLAFRKPELAEGDGDFERPALVVYDRLASKDRVPREAVDRDALIGNRGVVLRAEGVHLEQIRVPPIAICV